MRSQHVTYTRAKTIHAAVICVGMSIMISAVTCDMIGAVTCDMIGAVTCDMIGAVTCDM